MNSLLFTNKNINNTFKELKNNNIIISNDKIHSIAQVSLNKNIKLIKEIHQDVYDIYIVKKGSGIFRTGGLFIEKEKLNKSNSIGEIEGGKTQKISKGDILVIPPKTPHGFDNIKNIINYIVIKMKKDNSQIL